LSPATPHHLPPSTAYHHGIVIHHTTLSSPTTPIIIHVTIIHHAILTIIAATAVTAAKVIFGEGSLGLDLQQNKWQGQGSIPPSLSLAFPIFRRIPISFSPSSSSFRYWPGICSSTFIDFPS
jgi:hypothetical protein